MMSKQHYIKFAKMLKARRDEVTEASDSILDANLTDSLILRGRKAEINIIAEFTATIFAEDNPKFDRAKFLQACGMD